MHPTTRAALAERHRDEVFSPAPYLQVMRNRRLGAASPLEPAPLQPAPPAPLVTAPHLLRSLAG